MESIFNLIDEPWIMVMRFDCEIETVSIKTLFEKAHLYQRLAGEMPAQDNAILRLLIAILYSVFVRVDINGEENEIKEKKEALERWKSIWELGKFPIEPIQNYLNQYHNRFYLIDDKRPFYQIPEKLLLISGKKKGSLENIGTHYHGAKLNASISESGHKTRIFSERNGDAKEKLDYPEAARWLIYINAYDDAALKPKDKYKNKGTSISGVKSGVCWCGKLGNIEAVGKNLFQTLMLNLTLLQDGEKMWEPINTNDYLCCATWELDEPRATQRDEISVPSNPAALLTVQSRRISLDKEGNKINGYHVLIGDYFDSANAFKEQMTIWENGNNNKKISPKKYDLSKQSWREFSSLNIDTKRAPGIIKWIRCLMKAKLLSSENNVHFKNIAIYYDSSNSSIVNTYVDELSFNKLLLDKVGIKWRQWISEEIENCEKCADEIGKLEKEILLASGMSEDKAKNNSQVNKEIFFNRIDLPVRKWIAELDPKQHDEEYKNKLRKIIRDIALQIGKEMIEQVNDTKALYGRPVIEKNKNKNNKPVIRSAIKGYREFKRNI